MLTYPQEWQEWRTANRRVDSLRSAKELKALLAIVLDLEYAIDASDALLVELTKPENDVQRRALWSSALVAYTRCFLTGRRLRIPADVMTALDDVELLTHRRAIDERNKHVAHSVNEALEQVQILALIRPGADGVPSVVDLMHVVARQLVPPTDEVERFRAVAAKLRDEVRHRIRAQSHVVLQDARSKLDPELRSGRRL